MLLVRLTDGVPDKHPITLENFLLLFPATSFPGYLDASITEPLGFGIYSFSQEPQLGRYENKEELLPVRNDDEGVWYQTWGVVPMDDEEMAAVDERQRGFVLYDRNMRLQSTDWTQLGDAPLGEAQKQSFREYRQALRDMTDNPDLDIWNPSWPVLGNLGPQAAPEGVQQEAPDVVA